jgi:DHA2 family multidrug resistance protein
LLDFVQQVATHEAAARGGDTLQGYATALKVLGKLALREAQTQSFADAFFVIALCFVVATCMAPLMRKLGAPAAPVRDAH